MARLLLFAGGSRGDVQPYLALSVGLARAGHQVTLLVSAEVPPTADLSGVRVVTAAEGSAATAAVAGRLIEQGRLIAALRATGEGARSLALTTARSALPYAEQADLLVAGLGGLYAAQLLAQQLGRRFMPALLMPLSVTAERPSLLLPVPRLPGSLNRLTHRLTQRLLWFSLFRDSDRLVRRELFGLPPAHAAEQCALFDGSDGLLYGFSPQVVPPAADWPSTIAVTGAWQLPIDAEPPLPDAVERFLAAGPPPLVIGFGSMRNRDPRAVAEMVISALRRHGRRGILLSGWGGLRADALPDDLLLIDQVPHRRLLPRAAAVVHHGGAGTTMAGLSAGIPNLVVPFFGDQPYWARRVHELGVGPPPLARQRLSTERLTSAFDRLLHDQPMRERARQLGAAIQQEDGVGRAVELLTVAAEA
jgi:sterol 3beta-glucosyltransferase